MVLAFIAVAEAASVTLEADSQSLAEGQSVGLVLTVTDSSIRGGPPKIPAPAGLRISFESQQQQQLMLNYNLTTSTVYRYTLSAVEAGTYTVGPLKLATSNGSLTTGAVKLVVTERGQTSGVNELRGVFTTLPKWQGQVSVYHMRFSTDRQIANGNWIPPEGKGFAAEAAVEPLSDQASVGDGNTRVTVLDVYLPMRFTDAGKVLVPGGALNAQFVIERQRRRRGQLEQMFPDLGMFNDVRAELFSAEKQTLSIRPLPAAPAGYTGLVGQFRVSVATQGTTNAKVGDSLTQTVELVGDAPLAGVRLPGLSGTGFRVYDDQPVATASIREGKLVATSGLKRAIVPEQPGELVIPEQVLWTFDPVLGEYVPLRVPELRVQVQGTAKDAAMASFAGVAEPAESPPGVNFRTSPQTWVGLSGRWSWVLLLPGVGLAVWKWWARPRAALPEAAFGWGDLPPAGPERLAGIERLLRECTGARLGKAPAALHSEDLVGQPEWMLAWRAVERARYGDAGDLAEAEALVRRVTG